MATTTVNEDTATSATTVTATSTRDELRTRYLEASLDGRYQDSVDLYRAFAGL